ncbi:MAG: Uma2 family endonuclease [Myxococcaceae bacterium]
MSRSARQNDLSATAADLYAIPEAVRRHELVHGVLVEKAQPSAEHGTAQRKLGTFVDPFDRRPGGRLPGGWWLMTEVEIELAPDEIFRPDVLGWRRDRVPDRPKGNPIRLAPDWIAEVLSPSNSGTDRVEKLNAYHQHRVPYYWIVDPQEKTLSVFRWAEPGYLLTLAATAGQVVHAEPFEALALRVGELFGDEPADD